MKIEYVYGIMGILMLAIVLRCVIDHYDNTYFIVKTIVFMSLVFLTACFFVYCVQLYTDLLFIKKLSFALSKKICTAQEAWEILSHKRGMRLHNYIMSEYQTAFLIIKIMHEYSVISKDNEIADFTNEMYKDLQIPSKDLSNVDLYSLSLSAVAESTLNFITSPKNNLIKLFNVANLRGAQIFFFWLFVVVFVLFLLIQLLGLLGA
jgi:hypothetical protein